MLEELKNTVFKANLRLKESGLVILTWGNASQIDRESGLVVIKPSGIPYDAMTPNDMVTVDLNGNAVDGSLFSNNAVTVINFWFNGCKPCVAELSKLNELNDTIQSMGGEVIGINTETFDGNETAIKEASSILESQGAKYRNFSIDSNSDAGKYASDIMAFPTTILVDRNGNIVGDPMLGGIDDQANYDALMKQIQSVIDADSTNK